MGAQVYSSRNASTGSIWAARVAGMVPKKMPTEVAAASAMATDQREMGRSKSVKTRTDSGTASPTTMPTIPPISEMMTASARNWSLISR